MHISLYIHLYKGVIKRCTGNAPTSYAEGPWFESCFGKKFLSQSDSGYTEYFRISGFPPTQKQNINAVIQDAAHKTFGNIQKRFQFPYPYMMLLYNSFVDKCGHGGKERPTGRSPCLYYTTSQVC